MHGDLHARRDAAQVRLADIGAHVHRVAQAQAVYRHAAGDHAARFAHPGDHDAVTGRYQFGIGHGGTRLGQCGVGGGDPRLAGGDVLAAETGSNQ